MNKMLWLLTKYDLDAYHEKTNVKKVGLFETEQLAKDYATEVLGLTKEEFVWCCKLEEIIYIFD